MNYEEAEQHKAELVAAVRTQLKASDITKMRVTLGAAGLIVAALWLAGWYVRGGIDEFKNELANTHAELGYKWDNSQMASFASALDKQNRDLQHKDGTLGLNVPDPSMIAGAKAEAAEAK